jgi:hypothetical protein
MQYWTANGATNPPTTAKCLAALFALFFFIIVMLMHWSWLSFVHF